MEKRDLRLFNKIKDGDPVLNGLTRKYSGYAHVVALTLKEDYEKGLTDEQSAVAMNRKYSTEANVYYDVAAGHFEDANAKVRAILQG